MPACIVLPPLDFNAACGCGPRTAAAAATKNASENKNTVSSIHKRSRLESSGCPMAGDQGEALRDGHPLSSAWPSPLSVVPLFLALPHSARFISPSPPFLRRSAAAAPPSATGTEESRSGAGGPTVAELAGTTLSGIVHRAAWHFGGHIWRVCGALGRGGRPMTQFTNFNLLTYSSTCKKVSQSSNSNSSYLHTYYLPYDGCLGRNGLVGITLCSTAPCRLRPPPTAR